MQDWPVEAVQLIKNLKQEIEGLKKKINELENKLRLYENPHTPSSRQRFKGNKGGSNVFPGKHGGVIGHHGATHKVPEPDRIIPVTSDLCPCCGCLLGDPVDVQKRTIEEIPSPPKMAVTRFDIHTYICPGCGCKVTAHHRDCPKVGGLGISLMTNITLASWCPPTYSTIFRRSLGF